MNFRYGVMIVICFVCACRQGQNTEEAAPPAEVSMAAASGNEMTMATVHNPLFALTAGDTTAIHRLLREADSVRNFAPETAASMYKQVLRLSRNHSHNRILIKAYREIISCYQAIGDTAKVRLYLDRSISDLSQLIRFDGGDITLYHALIRFQEQQESWHQVLATYQEIVGKFRHMDQHAKEVLADVRLAAAEAYFSLATYDSVSILYTQNISMLKKASPGNYKLLMKSYMGLGTVNSRLKQDVNRSIAYFNKAAEIAGKFKDTTAAISIRSNIGAMYFDAKAYAQAKRYSQGALELAAAIQDPRHRRVIRSQNAYLIAASLIKEGQPNTALEYSRMALEYGAHTVSNTIKINGLYIMGYNLVQLGRYDAAKAYLSAGIQRAKETGTIDNLTSGYEQETVATS